MSSKQLWKIHVRNLDTRIGVGIHAHEQTPQRIRVNALIAAEYAAQPQSISECLSYEVIHDYVTREWPKRPHTDLLETLVNDLLLFIFNAHPGVQRAQVTVGKPDIFEQAQCVGVEAEWTREDFKRISQ